jgi:hypothetical protein
MGNMILIDRRAFLKARPDLAGQVSTMEDNSLRDSVQGLGPRRSFEIDEALPQDAPQQQQVSQLLPRDQKPQVHVELPEQSTPQTNLTPQANAPRSAILPRRTETIEAESAPVRLSERVANRDFVSPVVDEGLRSKSPGVRRLALRDSGVPEDVQDLVNAGVERPAKPDHSKDGKRGFWGGVKHVLEHAGKAALLGLSTGNPIAAVGAGIAGGINPEYADELEDRFITQPRWEREDLLARNRANDTVKRADALAARTGVHPLTGRKTLTAERFEQQAADSAERIRQGDERIAQADERYRLAERKTATAEKTARINRLLAAARIPGRVFSPEAKAELQRETGLTLPDDFSPMTYDVREDSNGRYQIIGIDRNTGFSTVDPVINQSGQPVSAPPRNAPSKPQFYYEGAARQELQKQLGITDPSAWVANPQFEEAVRREMEADKQAAQAGGYDASSEAEIRKRVQRKQKIAPQIRAGEAITADMVKQKAAEIYDRENKGTTAAPKSKAPAAPANRRQQQMDADEREYQQLYPSLSPAERKALEDAYQKDHGRPPRRPQGAANLSGESSLQDGLIPVDWKPRKPGSQHPSELVPIPPDRPNVDPDTQFKRHQGPDVSIPVNPYLPPDVERSKPAPDTDKSASADRFQMDVLGSVESGAYQTRAYLPPAMRKDFEGWKGDVVKRKFLVTHAGWTPRTFRKWQRFHGSEEKPLPDFTIGSGKIDVKTGIVHLRVLPKVLNQMRSFAAVYGKKKVEPSAPITNVPTA